MKPSNYRKRPAARWPVWLVSAACIVQPGIARAKVDDLVRQAMAAQTAGRPRVAVDLLLPHERARAGDPDFDYALGLAAADSGQPGIALPALQRVLAVQPGNVQARAEIARVYAMAGDVDTARAEFDTVVADPSLPDPVRQRVDRLARTYARQISGGGTDLSGFVDAEGGYDSNINQATAATTITLPVFAFLGRATLGGAARATNSAFGQVQGGVSVQHGLDRQARLFASALGFYRDNTAGNAFDQAAVAGTVGAGYTLANRDVVSVSGQAQQFWLGREGYRSGYSIIGQYTHRLAGGNALSGTLNVTRLDYRDAPLRDANRYSAAIGYADRTIFTSMTGGIERTLRAPFRHFGNDFVGIQAGTEYPLSRRVAVIGNMAAEYRHYLGDDPLYLGGRHDIQIDAAIGLRAILTEGVSLRPRVTVTRNDSNFALYDFRRVTASIALRAEF